MIAVSVLLELLLLLSPTVPRAVAGTSETSFIEYVRAYAEPQLLESNGRALDARLKLLDMAPKGARARIATFEFLNGKSTRLVARHLCLAAQRGVQVELLVDSKMGDRPGLPDPFDQTDDSQVVEELLQYLANCGARVIIYNHLESFIEVMGFRIPNLLLDPKRNGESINIIEFVIRMNRLLEKVEKIANEELFKAGIRVEIDPILENARKMALEFFHLYKLSKNATGDEQAPDGFENSVRRLEELYLEIVRDPAWLGARPEKLQIALQGFLARIKSDSYLKNIYAEIRRFNRVQHRKLFLVENRIAEEGCLIIGGRNFGDAYLTDERESFLDADVLLCRHHSSEANRAVSEGAASFEDLKTDLSDSLLRKENDLKLRALPADPNFAFANLIFPAGLSRRGLRTAPYQGALPKIERTLLPERIWPDARPVLGNAALGKGRNWRVLGSAWNPQQDKVREELLKRMQQERKEIYLETAYAEFDRNLRDALEKALQRGVQVRIVTNSFFVTDGLSKLTRVLMANWVQHMKAKYESRFEVRLTSFEAGHMTHLKGAAFACQPGAAGGFARSYLIGSHNFHPRSGRSDKESSLSWEEPSNCEGLSIDGTVHSREIFYQDLSRRLGTEVLVDYPDFFAELASATRAPLDRAPPSTRWLSRALRRVFYIEGEKSEYLKEEKRVEFILRLIDRGGLHDLLGLVL